MKKVEIMQIRDTKTPGLKSVFVRQEGEHNNTIGFLLGKKAPYRYAWHNAVSAEKLKNAKIGDDFNQIMGAEFNIYVKETTTKANEYSQVKRAGADGPILTCGGQPIYRSSVLLLATDRAAGDVLLQSDGAPVEVSQEATSGEGLAS